MSSDTLIGAIIGPYKILSKIGQGGMGEVYKGQHIELERPVAIKFLGRHLEIDEQLTQRFKREARAIATLRHHNIVVVYDFGAFEGGHYLVMEYVAGNDLRQQMNQRFTQNRAYAPEEILTLVEQVAAALDYAHAQGIIHRDIKPANIFINTDGEAILGDFGLVMLRDRISQATMGNTFGTPEYIAPEQAIDSRAAVPQSDIYALGGIIYEMVTSTLPFEADTPLDLALKHISEDPAPPRQYNPTLPQTVENVILQALNKAPQARYPTAQALVQALRQAWSGNTAPTTVVIPKITPLPLSATAQATPIYHTPTSASFEASTPPPPTRIPKPAPESNNSIPTRPSTPPPLTSPPITHRPTTPPATTPPQAPPRKKRGWLWGVILVIALIAMGGIGYISSQTGAWPFTTPTLAHTNTPVSTNPPTATLPPTATRLPTNTPTPIPTDTPPPAPGDARVRELDGMTMRFVPAGTFLMGAEKKGKDVREHERPQHEVMLDAFWMDETEVTTAQYKACVAAGGCKAPFTTTDYDKDNYAQRPITYISWNNAAAYCRWVAASTEQNITLPTEAQWEKAASWDPAKDKKYAYPWGDKPDDKRVALKDKTDIVGSHPDGASAYGIRDLAGNVWEWVNDWYGENYYDHPGEAQPIRNPTGPENGTYRVMRGGSFDSHGPKGKKELRTTHREGGRPYVAGSDERPAKSADLGFRCVLNGE